MILKQGVKLIPAIAFLLFVVGAFLSEKLWGIHFLAFLPLPQKLVLLFVSGVIIFVPKVLNSFSRLAATLFNKEHKLSWLASVGIAALMISLFLLFPIFQDEYGDAYRFQSRLDNVLTELPNGFVNDVFKLEFAPSEGRKSVLLMFGWLSNKFDATYLDVFKWVDALSGLGFVLALIWFVRQQIESRSWQLLLIVVGCLAPFTQVFYRHTETYAPVFLLSFLWLLGYARFFQIGKPRILVFLSITLPVLCKLHPMSWLLIAPLIIAWVQVLNSRRAKKSIKKFELKKVGRLLVSLSVLAGLYLYLVVFKDYADPRDLRNVKDIDRLFLPILSPEAPLDRYNLFSLNHILDYINAIFMWSVPLLVILGAAFLIRRKEDSEQPVRSELVGLATVLTLQMMLLFMLNPLVSMPMDWDLFSFPALTFLVISVVLVRQHEHELDHKALKSGVVGLVMLSAAFIPVNASAKSLSYRLESLGRHIFKTYYVHSNRILISAVGIHGDMDDYMERKDQMEIDLRPYALVGNDRLYANLFLDDGYYYLNTANDYDKAKAKLTTAQRYNPEQPQIAELLARATMFADANDPAKHEERYYRIEQFGVRLMREFREFGKAQAHFQSAIKEYPDSTVLTMFLMESRFQQGDYAGAYYNSLKLVEEKYPDQIKALRIAVHCALEAGMYQEAFKHSEEYLKVSPDDKLILEVYSRLEKMDRPEELRKLFIRR